jgi:alkaline phosphatase D
VVTHVASIIDHSIVLSLQAMPSPTPQIHCHDLLPTEPAAPGSSRRGFVRGLAFGAMALSGLSLAACGGRDDESDATFDHGVASGDPLSDRVVLWTRVSTNEAELAVTWEVASDAAFSSVVASGTVTTSAARDHTVKIDAGGLQPTRTYWYRFKAGTATSETGRTKTLPTNGVTQVRLAVFSCANYPAGFFNVYAEAAKQDDLDATVHLGDYLYEYGRDGYASADAQALDRLVVPATEVVSLAGYRARHALYKTDPDLRALHACAPMIAVWDDHEIANDTYRNGAENHQAATEGDFVARKAAAIQAYHEWMPTRADVPERIYRSFDFGSLVSLHMLDSRVIGRDQQLAYSNFIGTAGFDAAGFAVAVADPLRQMIGVEQRTWLQQQLGASTATWQVLGQQVLMGRMNLPAPILAEVNSPGSGVTVSQYVTIAGKAQTDPSALTPAEQAVLAQPAIPYNLDAWDGYAAAREAVLASARTLDKNLVVLSGDTHNAWASDLQDASGNSIGVEFATPAVSSPGLETLLTGEEPSGLAASLTQLIGPLRYCDTSRRGFMLLTATATECRADWVYVNTVSSRTYFAVTDKSLSVLPGVGNRRISETRGPWWM